MIYTIENEQLKVEISDKGAEIMSIVGKKTGHEYLWQGDKTYWGGRATVLFPICGRLTDGKYTYGGKTYEMILHGFSKLSTHKVIAQTKESITFELCADEESKAIYPFDFIFRMTYTLEGASLKNLFTVINEKEEDLPFSVGGHPGFNVPFIEGEQFEDYYLEFENAVPCERLVMSPTCYYTGANEPFPLKDGKIIELRHELFANDAIFLTGTDRTVSLKSKKNDRAVTVNFSDKMVNLGLWQKPNTDAPYVCIEPWHGVPAYDGKVDDFATKNLFTHLKKGETYTNEFTITITE
jgi:galactose mutarotase-like enzyme